MILFAKDLLYAQVVLWGSAMALCGVVKNLGGLIGLRVLLGLFE